MSTRRVPTRWHPSLRYEPLRGHPFARPPFSIVEPRESDHRLPHLSIPPRNDAGRTSLFKGISKQLAYIQLSRRSLVKLCVSVADESGERGEHHFLGCCLSLSPRHLPAVVAEAAAAREGESGGGGFRGGSASSVSLPRCRSPRGSLCPSAAWQRPYVCDRLGSAG